MQSEQNISLVRAINMIVGINVYMIGVQIYYTVYDRSTIVRYVQQQQQYQYLCCGIYNTILWYIQYYTVVYTILCCGIYNTKLCDIQDYAEYQQDYVIWYTILHYMVYNTSCYVMQYQKQYQKHDTTYRVSLLLCINNSILHRDISAYAPDTSITVQQLL